MTSEDARHEPGIAQIDKEWAAVDDDEIVVKRSTRSEVKRELRRRRLLSSDYEIVALPKTHGSAFI